MTNLEKWERFLIQKKWKYKKVNSKFGPSILVKVCNKLQRCNIFIGESKLNFNFYGITHWNSDKKFRLTKCSRYCFTIRNGSLHIFTSTNNRGIRHLGSQGPNQITFHINSFFGQRFRIIDPIRKNRKNKFQQVLRFYGQLNKLKGYENINKDTLLKWCYPSIENFPIMLNETSIVFPVLRERNLGLNAICKKIFGHKSKLIVKSILTEHKYINTIVNFGYLLKPFLNRGQMEQFIQFNTFNGNAIWEAKSSEISKYRKFFRQFTAEQLMHLFSQPYRNYHLMDSCRQFSEFPGKLIIPNKVKDWEHIHDDLILQYRRLQTEDYKFNIAPNLEKIHGTTLNDEVIIVPQSRHELVDWGTKMNNCIAGYHSQFNTGKTILLGVKKNDELIYNIEINNGEIRQFMKNRNSPAPKEVIEKYLKVFREYKLVA